MRLFLCVCCFAVGLLALPGHAQSVKEFEAASLRRLPAGAKPEANDVDFFASEASADRKVPSLLSDDLTFFDLLVTAYDIADAGLHHSLLQQLPNWAGVEEFHLSARVPDGTTVRDMRQMFRTLLRDRFALAVHEETRSVPVLLLQMDRKQKSHLIPFRGTCDALLPADSPDACVTHSRFENGMMHVTFHGETLDQMSNQLSGFAYYMGGLKFGPVVNDTGIEGRFDASFTFLPLLTADVAGGGPTLVDALRQELGMVLRKGERPMTLLVVDHLEQPKEE